MNGGVTPQADGFIRAERNLKRAKTDRATAYAALEDDMAEEENSE